MIQFHENDNAFTFIRDEHAIAIGEYSEDGFVLLHNEQLHTFSNAMQAFTPEMAQNGGEFMQGIFANDSSESGGFSAF